MRNPQRLIPIEILFLIVAWSMMTVSLHCGQNRCGSVFADARPEIKVPADARGILVGGGLVFDFARFVFVTPIFAFLLTNFGPNFVSLVLWIVVAHDACFEFASGFSLKF